MLANVFSGDMMDFGRIGLWGVAVIALGLLVYFLGPKIRGARLLPVRLIGLLLVAVGALGAMKIL